MQQPDPEEQIARKYADDAMQLMTHAIGNVEMVMVIRDGSWDEPRRRAAVLALVDVVLEDRPHPNNRDAAPPGAFEPGRSIEGEPSDAALASLPRAAAFAVAVGLAGAALVWWLLW